MVTRHAFRNQSQPLIWRTEKSSASFRFRRIVRMMKSHEAQVNAWLTSMEW